jgi:hypothetical protein
MKPRILQQISATILSLMAMLPTIGRAQINPGSTGSDGALDFSAITNATNVVIDMSDHPTGIYNYTYVNIPANVTVTFIPNANNTPVVWLVQNNVVISGNVSVSGKNFGNGSGVSSLGGSGGPGGWSGGNGGSGGTSGQGPGGGAAALSGLAGGGSYNYGNQFLIPLLGGSGGGGNNNGGGGGGGALLIAAANSININGSVLSQGGNGFGNNEGSGSGGAIRLVASQVSGNGQILANGGRNGQSGGAGRLRFDTYDNEFSGGIFGQFTSGSQFIIIPSAGQLPQLAVTSVGGVPVSASPTGVLSTPDAVLSAQQNNPIPIVVSCVNLPLNSTITVSVTPMNGSPVSAVGYNNTGTQSSSTATVSLNMPRGGGLIYATAATGN